MTIPQLKHFLSTRPALNPNILETESNLAQGTLSKALRGKRRLSKKAVEKLLPVLVKYGWA